VDLMLGKKSWRWDRIQAGGLPPLVTLPGRYPFSTFFVISSVILGFGMVGREATEFEWAYLLTSRHLRNGLGIYGLGIPPYRAYTYPPFMAALWLPFALLPKAVERAAWFLLNAACMVYLWRGCWKLAGGGRLEGDPAGIDRREQIAAWLGLGSCVIYLLNNMDHQQTDVVIAAMLIGGCLALGRSRDMLAATCFGLAAGMKCTPLLWAPYLLWRGRARAALWVAAVAVGVNFLPNLVSHPPRGGLWLAEWFERYLRPMGNPDFFPGKWHAWILDNQALSGLANRWTLTRCVWSADGLSVVDRPSPVSIGTFRWLLYSAEGVLLLSVFLAMRRGRRVLPVEPPAPTPEALDYSSVLLLMLLLSPMSSKSHFSTMLLPGFCLARISVHRGSRMLWVLLSASIVAGLTTAPVWGKTVGRFSMWCGMITWGALFLLAGCVLSLLFDPAGGADRQVEQQSRLRPRAMANEKER
jgi:hypothetical protein